MSERWWNKGISWIYIFVNFQFLSYGRVNFYLFYFYFCILIYLFIICLSLTTKHFICLSFCFFFTPSISLLICIEFLVDFFSYLILFFVVESFEIYNWKLFLHTILTHSWVFQIHNSFVVPKKLNQNKRNQLGSCLLERKKILINNFTSGDRAFHPLILWIWCHQEQES